MESPLLLEHVNLNVGDAGPAGHRWPISANSHAWHRDVVRVCLWC